MSYDLNVNRLVYRMTSQMIALFLLFLASSLAAPGTTPSEILSSSGNSTEDKQVYKELNNLNSTTNVTVQTESHSSIGLKTDCDGICQLCNATGKLEEDGSCTCLSDNGGAVECVHFPRYKKELKQSNEDPTKAVTETGKEAERDQRCLGLLGSSKDGPPAPANSLLGSPSDGLLSLSPADRALEIRNRVEALRAITIANLQKALENRPALKIEPLKVPAIPTLPKVPLPVSPYIGVSVENAEIKGNQEKTKDEGEALIVSQDEVVQAKNPLVESKPEIPSKTFIDFNMPGFTFNSQIPSFQSGPSIFTPGRINMRIPQLPANFPTQQLLRTQLTSFDPFGNYRRQGRVIRSSGPILLVQSPIVPYPPSYYDPYYLSATESSPVVDQDHLSPEEPTSDDTMDSQNQSTNQGGSLSTSNINSSGFTQNIFKVADGDLANIGKLLDSSGAEKGIGSMVQGLLGFSKKNKEIVLEENTGSSTHLDTEQKS